MWWITPFTPPQAFGFVTLIVTMGFVGGLVLSAVKRSLGVWGRYPATFFHLVVTFFLFEASCMGQVQEKAIMDYRGL